MIEMALENIRDEIEDHLYFPFRRLLCEIGLLDINKEIVMLDRKIDEELKKLSKDELDELHYILSNGRYGT